MFLCVSYRPNWWEPEVDAAGGPDIHGARTHHTGTAQRLQSTKFAETPTVWGWVQTKPWGHFWHLKKSEFPAVCKINSRPCLSKDAHRQSYTVRGSFWALILGPSVSYKCLDHHLRRFLGKAMMSHFRTKPVSGRLFVLLVLFLLIFPIYFLSLPFCVCVPPVDRRSEWQNPTSQRAFAGTTSSCESAFFPFFFSRVV